MIRVRLARALRRLVDLLDPPPEVIGRAVVADGYAQGRADLQLVHTRREPGMWPVGPHEPPECHGSGCPAHEPIRRALRGDLP